MAGRRTGQAGFSRTHPPSPLGYHFFREQMSVVQPRSCGRKSDIRLSYLCAVLGALNRPTLRLGVPFHRLLLAFGGPLLVFSGSLLRAFRTVWPAEDLARGWQGPGQAQTKQNEYSKSFHSAADTISLPQLIFPRRQCQFTKGYDPRVTFSAIFCRQEAFRPRTPAASETAAKMQSMFRHFG